MPAPAAAPGRTSASAERFRACALLAASSVLAAACTSSETSITAPTAARCVVTVANSMEMVPAAGGAGTLAISAARDCTWAASNGSSWIVITSATSGQGEGSIAYRVAANGAPARRQAAIEVNNTAATIVQEAAECRFTVTPTTLAVAQPGGAAAIQVQASAACPWTASTAAAWMRITAGASGEGDGTVSVAADANEGAARSGTLVVAGVSVAVEQTAKTPAPGPVPPPPPPAPAPPPPAPACDYSIQPGGQTIAAAGGSGTIDVTASAGSCAWTAASNTAWVAITGGASGTGSGRVTFSVAANAGGSRTGSIGVAGRTFTITQAAPSCSYAINPSSQAIAASGGSATVTVATGSACAWTAAGNAPWITIASGATGTGDGTVRLNVAANQGAARTGTATIAAQTFTVTQAAAPCSFAISPATIDVPAGGGDATAAVTAGTGCAWTAASNAAWITITGTPSGTGNGTVRFNAAANPGAARSGTVTIGGQTLTVTQSAAPCTYQVAPSSQPVPAGGGSGSVSVTTALACGWTAASNNADWLTLTGASAGTGSGTVSFAAAANAGPLRAGTLTIAGQMVTVTQDAAPCSFGIDVTSQTFGAAGGTGSVSVATGGWCAWTAMSNNADWLTVTGGTPATGSGPVAFAVSANTTGADRTGTLTVAGLTFTVTQTAQ